MLNDLELDELWRKPWEFEVPTVPFPREKMGDFFAHLDLPFWMAVIENQARTAALRALVRGLEPYADFVHNTSWHDVVFEKEHVAFRGAGVAIGAFWVSQELARTLPDATLRDAVEYAIGDALIELIRGKLFFEVEWCNSDLWGFEYDKHLMSVSQRLWCLLCHPAVSIFQEGTEAQVVRAQSSSLLHFAAWQDVPLDDHKPAGELLCSLLEDSQKHSAEPDKWEKYTWELFLDPCSEDLPVRRALLTADSRVGVSGPLSEWELHTLAIAVKKHRKAGNNARQAARFLAKSLGPRIGSALYSWSELSGFAGPSEHTYARHVRGELQKIHRRKEKWD